MTETLKDRLDRLEFSLHQNMAILLAGKIASATKEHISHEDIESFNTNDIEVNVKLKDGRVITLNRKTEQLVYDSFAQVH